MSGDNEQTESITISVRVSPKTDDEVKALINTGKHTTKSDVLHTALLEYLNRELIMEEFHKFFILEMDDPEAREKMKIIIKELFNKI